MRYMAFMLLAGCMQAPQGGFCDLARPIYFDSAETINWLAENDRWMLQAVVGHNEIHKGLCR